MTGYEKINYGSDNRFDYQCPTTLDKANWPYDCDRGSTMKVVNETTHEVDHYEDFDGTNWNI